MLDIFGGVGVPSGRAYIGKAIYSKIKILPAATYKVGM